MKCPNCQTNNPDTAEWCSLCLTRFDARADEPPAAIPASNASTQSKPEAAVWEEIGTAPGGRAVAPTPEATREAEVIAGPIRKKGELVEWVCPRCERTNAIDSRSCELCGTSIYEAFEAVEKTDRTAAPRNANVAAVLSLIPGAGHFYVRRAGDGVLRLTLGVWWASMAFLVRTSPWPLLAVKVSHILAVIGLAGVSAVDAYRAATTHRPPVLLNKKVVIFGSLFSIGILLASLAFGMLIET